MTLNTEELKTIKIAIEKRTEAIAIIGYDDRPEFSKHVNLLKKLWNNLEAGQRLPQNQKSLLQGLAKTEIMKEVEDFQNVIYTSTDIELFEIAKLQKGKLNHVYLLEELYNKIHKKQDAIKLTKEMMSIYELLGNLPLTKVFYSSVNEKIYKIGIPVNNKQLLKIKLDDNEGCYPFNIGEIEKNRNTYTYCENIEQVQQLLKNYAARNRLTNRMLFIQHILIQNLKNQL